MGGYTRAVSGQRLGKHVPAARQQSLNNAKVGTTMEDMCFLCGLCRDVISKRQGRLIVLHGSLWKEDFSRRQRNIKITLHKALIRSVITYACLAWELAANTYLLQSQRLQNKVLRTTGNFSRCASVRDLYTAFNLPYVHDTTKLQAASRSHTKSWEWTYS
jgi:hypothetical protein